MKSYRTRVDLLVVGASGFLGHEITRQAWLAGHRVVATFHRLAAPLAGVDWRALDIRRRADVTALAVDVHPDAIINAAFRKAIGQSPLMAACTSPRPQLRHVLGWCMCQAMRSSLGMATSYMGRRQGWVAVMVRPRNQSRGKARRGCL
jgi:NAD(P)-dependent dehydrogenase (short-subunit alcohol dehydrogenase family)